MIPTTTYCYATTIRRAQCATYRHGHIWFDHSHHPEHGYGYVAASRSTNKAVIYMFGKVRRTDWLPVRETRTAMEQDQVDRSEEYMSEYDSEEEEAMVIPRGNDGDGQHYIQSLRAFRQAGKKEEGKREERREKMEN